MNSRWTGLEEKAASTASPRRSTPAVKGRMSLRRLIERFTHGPRAVLGLPKVHIAEGAQANITLFDPEVDWTCTEADLVSKSHNTPFLGQRLTGRALGVVSGSVVRVVGAVAEGVR